MRSLILGLAILFVALVFAALPILITGKGLLFTLAAGHPTVATRTTTIAAALSAGFAALSLLLTIAAPRFPRKYYQLQGYARHAMLFALACLVVAAGSVVWRQMVYGLGA